MYIYPVVFVIVTYSGCTQFCRVSVDNQNALFPFLDVYLRVLGKKVGVAKCIKELFINNRSLCSQVSESQIRTIINCICDKERKSPRICHLLNVILMLALFAHLITHPPRSLDLFRPSLYPAANLTLSARRISSSKSSSRNKRRLLSSSMILKVAK